MAAPKLGNSRMTYLNAVRPAALVLAAAASLAAIAPAKATAMGEWDFLSSDKSCSIVTRSDAGLLVMMTTKSGASGMMVAPVDEALISSASSYPLKVKINGMDDIDMTGETGEFGGSKIIYLPIKAAAIAAGEADGFALRVKLNDAVLFDKDMHGSNQAFAAFAACSKAFTG